MGGVSIAIRSGIGWSGPRTFLLSLDSMLGCMGNHAKLFLALVAIVQVSAPSVAQTLLPPPSPQTVEDIAAFARENITRARVSDGSNVPPETPQELARPIIPASLVRQTVARGFLTGEIEACGMDWQAGSFRPYMKAIRSGGRYSDKQLAYIGILHGLAQGEGSAAVAKLGRSCTAGHIERLEATVRRAPVLTP